MPTFQQFDYIEILSNNQLARMPKEIDANLNLFDDNPEALLLRLISGTVNIEHNISNTIIFPRKNYTDLDFTVNQNVNSNTLLKIFNNGSNTNNQAISKEFFSKYYRKCTTYGNREFFQNLVSEISNFLYFQSIGSNTTAFLHLYRCIELISYTFPLFYASKSKNYQATFRKLNDFFKDLSNKDGEITFLKFFINETLFKKLALLDSDLNLVIRTTDSFLQETYYNLIFDFCNKNNIRLKNNCIPHSKIVISRRFLLSFIVNLRNRYFHLASGGYNENISSRQLSESDIFFEIINDIGMNWVAQIYLEILILSVEDLI